LLFGYLGDRFGRKFSLVLAIGLMTVVTGLISVLPTEATFWGAPFLLLGCRILQGISAGGEGYGSVIFALEHWHASRHGRITSIMSAAAVSGVLGATGSVALLGSLSNLQTSWRWLFALGASLGLVGLISRQTLHETPVFLSEKKDTRSVLVTLVRASWPQLLRSMVMSCGVAGLQLTLASYLTIYLSTHREMSFVRASGLMTIMLTLYLPLLLLAGFVVDRFSGRVVLKWAALGALVVSWPLFATLAYGTLPGVVVAILLFAGLTALATAAKGAIMFQLFPTSVRYTGVSIGYAVGVSVFGGGAPLIHEMLIEWTGSLLAPAAFTALCASLGLVALYGVVLRSSFR
jgi:MHS family proline/betaine transporter-like MFS transporter